MTPPVTIRYANEADTSALTALAMRSKAHWGYSPEFMQACREELSVSPQDIKSQDIEYLVCEIGDRLIGFYSLQKRDLYQYELDALFVDPNYIGQGIGRLLMDHAKKALLNREAKTLLIQSDPNAEKFYLAAGGTKVGVRESDSVPGRFLTEYCIDLTRASVG